MVRREVFCLGGSAMALILERTALANPIIDELAKSDITNDCQSLNKGDYAQALREVNFYGLSGVLSRSVGCKSPHKHVLFIPERYLETPSLVDSEFDRELADGTRLKKFVTSRAYDMSLMVKVTVGAHRHDVFLSKSDLISVRDSVEGITAIAFQSNLFTGETEPGHLFRISRLSRSRI